VASFAHTVHYVQQYFPQSCGIFPNFANPTSPLQPGTQAHRARSALTRLATCCTASVSATEAASHYGTMATNGIERGPSHCLRAAGWAHQRQPKGMIQQLADEDCGLVPDVVVFERGLQQGKLFLDVCAP